ARRMTGTVDSYVRALLSVEVATDESAAAEVLDVWVDTGFTGDLVIPQTEIDRMGLQKCGTIEGVLADGTTGRFRKYACWVEWFNERKLVEAVANDGDYPLLDVGLPVGHDLHVSYSAMTVLAEQ